LTSTSFTASALKTLLLLRDVSATALACGWCLPATHTGNAEGLSYYFILRKNVGILSDRSHLFIIRYHYIYTYTELSCHFTLDALISHPKPSVPLALDTYTATTPPSPPPYTPARHALSSASLSKIIELCL
jgi:hypothetical protein